MKFIFAHTHFRRGLALLILSLFFCESSFGQVKEPDFSAGIELDVLPFATGGYFGAGWIGIRQFRVRGLLARVNMPEIVVDDDFRDNDITSYALLLDYFPVKRMEKIWLAAGIVYWDGSIRERQSGIKKSYDSFLLNGSLGYRFVVHKKIYLSPWAGLSIRFAGDSKVIIAGEKFRPKTLNPEASVKIGFSF